MPGHNMITAKKIILAIFLAATSGSVYCQQSLQLWYNKPAEKWTEALPVGNGRLGAMIFSGIENDRIQFNEETLWTGEPREYNRKGAHAYLPVLRKLLAEGKQKEAEQLAEKYFMGLKSNEGKRQEWFDMVRSFKGFNGDPTSAVYDDRSWKEMQVPSYEGWEAIGYEGLDGAVIFRTTFELPADWQGKNLVLDLNRIRDHDFTYINGKLAGNTEGGDPRKYVIPSALIVPGKNSIAVQVLNYFDKGGIAGYKDTTRHIGIYPEGAEQKKISLVKPWKYYFQHDEPPAVPRYQADYQPFGDLWLQFRGINQTTGYRRQLDLENAIVTTSFTSGGIQYTRNYLASQPDQVIVIHLAASKKGSISFTASLTSPHKNFLVKKLDDQTISLSVKVRNGVLKGESLLKIQTVNGSVSVVGDKIIVANADEATICLTAATSYRNYKDVSANSVELCRTYAKHWKGKTWNQLKAAHVSEYEKYFNGFSIDLGKSENEKLPTDERIRQFAASDDPSFVALYAQYGRYLLISSSRPGTRPPNLQGIWNDLLAPPWGSKYTTNINAEMNYWPAELLNLSSLHEPLFTMIKELSEAGKVTAKEYYNAPGWVLHHNTDVWRGTAPINAANHGIWVTGGGWLSHHLWEHYLFTQDKNFLQKEAFPAMKEAARFFEHFLVRDSVTGWFISTPSNSPEQGGLVAGPAMDHQIIRSLFKAVIMAGEILKTDKSFRDSLQIKLDEIAPDQVGKHGQLQEWLEDVDDPNNKHRHVSHLWAVYPGNEINWDEHPALMKAAQQSLIYRGDAATGWSLGWKINLWARFKDGDHAFRLIQMLLSPAEKGGAGSYVNLFDAHPPFQIDGNFGGAAGIGEMILQSHTKYIDLLPALPAALKNGEVKGICARGGFRLNIKWNDGKLVGTELVSLHGNDALIRYNGKTLSLKTQKGKTYQVDGALLLKK